MQQNTTCEASATSIIWSPPLVRIKFVNRKRVARKYFKSTLCVVSRRFCSMFWMLNFNLFGVRPSHRNSQNTTYIMKNSFKLAFQTKTKNEKVQITTGICDYAKNKVATCKRRLLDNRPLAWARATFWSEPQQTLLRLCIVQGGSANPRLCIIQAQVIRDQSCIMCKRTLAVRKLEREHLRRACQWLCITEGVHVHDFACIMYKRTLAVRNPRLCIIQGEPRN